MAGDHITNLNVEQLDIAGSESALTNLESQIANVDSHLAAGEHAISLTINDAQAHDLVAHGDHFTLGNHDVILDGAHSTHLSTTLKDIEGLNISNVSVGAGGLTIDMGGSTFDNLMGSGLPSFTGGNVSLSLDSINELTGGMKHLSADIGALADHGINQISLEHLNTSSLEQLLAPHGAGLSDFESLANAVNVYDQSVGAHPTISLSITDAQAHSLATDHLSFMAGDHVTMHTQGSHLSSTLKELESLHVNAVDVSGGSINALGVEHISLNLGPIDLNAATAESLARSLPAFTLDSLETAKGAHSLDVTLDLNETQRNELSLLNPTISHDLLSALHAAGITSIEAPISLDQVTHPGDWMNLGLVGQLHSAGISYEQGIIGGGDSHKPLSLDNALADEISALHGAHRLNDAQALAASDAFYGLDVLHNFTSPDKFGDLLHALTSSGVSEFVVDSGNVQISDSLASALIDAGMLQALPSANLVLDASAQATKLESMGEDYYAHLSTSLKSIADLGIHTIEPGQASHLFIDLGLPAHDANAMADISQLLHSLDPANSATHLTNAGVDITLVLTSDEAMAIKHSESGQFSAADMQHLENLGITNIAVVDPTGVAKDAHLESIVPQDHAPLPPVNIIGAHDPLYDELHTHGGVPHK